MNNERLEMLIPDIEKAAKRLASEYKSIEYDDIFQDLCVWVLEEKYELKTHAEGGRPVEFLIKAGRRLCADDINSRIPRVDVYHYSPKSVRKLLDAGALFYRGGDVAGRSDLLEAYEQLGDDEQADVKRAFLDGDADYRRPGAKAMAASRAVEKLSNRMNRIGEHRSEWHREREISGYIGSRRFMNQSQSDY